MSFPSVHHGFRSRQTQDQGWRGRRYFRESPLPALLLWIFAECIFPVHSNKEQKGESLSRNQGKCLLKRAHKGISALCCDCPFYSRRTNLCGDTYETQETVRFCWLGK